MKRLSGMWVICERDVNQKRDGFVSPVSYSGHLLICSKCIVVTSLISSGIVDGRTTQCTAHINSERHNQRRGAAGGLLMWHFATGRRGALLRRAISREEVPQPPSIYETASTCNVLYIVRKRRIQPHSSECALREKYRWGTLQRQQLKRQ